MRQICTRCHVVRIEDPRTEEGFYYDWPPTGALLASGWPECRKSGSHEFVDFDIEVESYLAKQDQEWETGEAEVNWEVLLEEEEIPAKSMIIRPTTVRPTTPPDILKPGRATWIWDHELGMHIPCCTMILRTGYACGNGPLVGPAVDTGDCGMHGAADPDPEEPLVVKDWGKIWNVADPDFASPPPEDEFADDDPF